MFFLEEIEKIKEQLNNNTDILVREIKVSNKTVSMIFYKSTIDKMLFVQSIISPLIEYSGEVTLQNLQEKVLKVIEVEKVKKEDFVKAVIRNKVLLFVEGEEDALGIDIEYLPTRQPEEPPTSPTIQGPRQGFTESVKTTVALMRKQLPSKHLVIKNFYVGEISHTQVCMFYLDNIADKKIIKKLTKKIQEINTDGIIDSHYLVEFLSERPNSMFEQYG